MAKVKVTCATLDLLSFVHAAPSAFKHLRAVVSSAKLQIFQQYQKYCEIIG